MDAMIAVPEGFAAATVAREGDAGRAWVAGLPALVRALCAEWRLAVDGAVMHGYLGLVVPVRRGDEPCVLKISWLEESTRDEATALAAWDGRGAVRLLKADAARGALLLERLDFRRTLADVEIAVAVGVAGRLLRRLAIPAPPGLRTARDVASALSHALPERWERLGRPLARRTLDEACDLARRLGASSGAVLVNYDLVYADVLAGEREPWLAVDPKVVAGDAEYGVAQLLWRRLEDMQEHGGLDRFFPALVEAAALDPALARGWTLVRTVEYWLWALGAGLTADPARCARVVAWLGRSTGQA